VQFSFTTIRHSLHFLRRLYLAILYFSGQVGPILAYTIVLWFFAIAQRLRVVPLLFYLELLVQQLCLWRWRSCWTMCGGFVLLALEVLWY